MGYSIWEIAKAFIDDHFELAIDLYTQATAVDPNKSEFYSDRAQANIKSNNLTEAVENLMGRPLVFFRYFGSGVLLSVDSKFSYGQPRFKFERWSYGFGIEGKNVKIGAKKITKKVSGLVLQKILCNNQSL
ncbi:putative tetratricopeptide-like helical domain-containing protein [Rosa chinensis]|uniref:Putative tetratricopeptide-like helical domain-containing protein n=1 Tax=Rosa chinensis TaxID=74649 RepID=A0A2P6QF29_ROSCH|nr:putative tetratricopeptide-like helical domain-containing protein [Rosa chinensis]